MSPGKRPVCLGPDADANREPHASHRLREPLSPRLTSASARDPQHEDSRAVPWGDLGRPQGTLELPNASLQVGPTLGPHACGSQGSEPRGRQGAPRPTRGAGGRRGSSRLFPAWGQTTPAPLGPRARDTDLVAAQRFLTDTSGEFPLIPAPWQKPKPGSGGDSGGRRAATQDSCCMPSAVATLLWAHLREEE